MTFSNHVSVMDRRPPGGESFPETPLGERGPRSARRRPVSGRRGSRRRGIILLMSLSLLTLFLMMLVTLIVITGQYRQSARVQARIDRVGDPAQKITDIALKTALIGTADGNVDIAPHSLLADLYGSSQQGVVQGAATTTSGHITIPFLAPGLDLYTQTSAGYFSGCVVTFVSGNAPKDLSVRVLEYRRPTAAGGPGVLLIARTSPESPGKQIDAVVDGDDFIINGRPFSGYGAGYGPNDASDPRQGYSISTTWLQPHSYPGGPTTVSLPAALLPNYRIYDPALTTMAAGRLNEDYDAVDYQNMFLAYVPANATRADQIVPSFWRPELINYWRHFTFDHDGDGANPVSLWYESDTGVPGGPVTGARARERNNFYRMLSLRPLPTDHPDFTGGNPDFAVSSANIMQPLKLLTGSNDIDENGAPDDDLSTNPAMPGTTYDPLLPQLQVTDVNGNGIVDQWDVDNDGDGLTDSIWIDVGLPVQRTADGKLYKPLVAFLIRDLDGLSNLNAHMHQGFAFAKRGDLGDLDPAYTPPAAPIENGPVTAGIATRSKGRGYGPAELGLSYAYNDVFSGSSRKLLDDGAGTPQLLSVLAGRYSRAPGDQHAGRVGVNDFASRLTQLYVPDTFPYNAVSAYGSPPDVWGAHGIALDYTGQPWVDRVRKTTAQLEPYAGGKTETIDEPYEIDLYTASSSAADITLNRYSPDTPYSLAELERVLRWNDSDASFLPGRLATAALGALDSPQARRLVTTHSSHIPFAPSSVPPERRTSNDARSWGLYELYRERLIRYMNVNQPPFNGTAFNQANPNPDHLAWFDDQIKRMMPWETWQGMKFDLNRPWQNGADDDGDFIVDEPAEAAAGTEQAFASLGTLPPELAGYAGLFDQLGIENDIPALADYPQQGITQPAFARQIYARHLYCLAMMLADYDPTGTGTALNLRSGFRAVAAFENGPTNPVEAHELFARRMAQWAINVVDARDPDSICTPFEYDVNPLNGWQLDPDTSDATKLDIDGEPGTVEGGERRLVWGMEAPDLLITETLAFHNRRVKDTSSADYRLAGGTGPTAGDDDLDQYRIPQGSLFVELYAAGNRRSNDPHVARELYDANGNLDVGRVAPGDSPVWRLAVSVPHGTLTAGQTPKQRLDDPLLRELTSFDIMPPLTPPAPGTTENINLDLLSHSSYSSTPVLSTPMNVPLERYVWLTNVNPGAASNTFYARNVTLSAASASGQRPSDATLAPGRYLVVGPRANTVIGQTDDSIATTLVDNSPHRIDLSAGTQAYDFDTTARPTTANYGAKIFQGGALICAANKPAAWTYDPAEGIGMNISEPLPQATYYPEPTGSVGVTAPERDGYMTGTDESTIPDRPFDETLGPLSAKAEYDYTQSNSELSRTIFLQRLADPTRAYNALTNPYLTFDWQQVDLTVFNGDDRRPDTWLISAGQYFDQPDEHTATPMAFGTTERNARPVNFMSRERGSRGRQPGAAADSNYPPLAGDPRDTQLWPLRSTDPVRSHERTAAPAALKFRYNLAHTLGYMNVTMGMDHAPGLASYTPPADAEPAQYRNQYFGAPNEPFPWITRFDAPFASPMEILNVPHTSQSTLGLNWTTDQSIGAPPGSSIPYGRNGGSPQDFAGMYKYLLNMFYSSNPRNSSEAPPLSPGFYSPHLYRLFDYVETPSVFAHSRQLVHEEDSSGAFNAPGTLTRGRSFVSRFRDPGRINLNTMPKEVWNSFGYSHDYQKSEDDFANSRRGFTATGASTWHYPTRIAKPFREASKADLAPLVGPLPGGGGENRLRQSGVDATLLRSFPSSSGVRVPMFAGDQSTASYENTDRNPHFRYESMTRMPNLTSTQSNVYAVWVTVGYFEASKTRPAYANYAGQPLPDGVWLGQEVGADTGRNRRHRGFYVIDRSIPVAFQPGSEHNVEKTILLRRYLD